MPIYVKKATFRGFTAKIDCLMPILTSHHQHCSTLVEIMEFTMLRQTSRSIITLSRSCLMMPVSLEINAGYENEQFLF